MTGQWSRGAGLQRLFQRWTLAAGFVLGRIGTLPARPAVEPHPFVLMLSEPQSGFAPTEVIDGRQTLILSQVLDVRGSHLQRTDVN
ncbi:MAG: hypothetical protein M3121_01640 [Chloroflexota bacterium]|nr:hypothetical protein [Chloroflexota bacterium]